MIADALALQELLVSAPRHLYHVGRLASLVGPVVPPVIVGISGLQVVSAAGYWLGLMPSTERVIPATLVVMALIDLALAGVIRFAARHGHVELAGCALILVCLVLSGGLCLVASVSDQRITIALPYCVLVAVGATWFWLRAWHLAAGLLAIFTPPLALLLTSSPTAVEWSFSIQISTVTILTSVGIYLLVRRTNARLFAMAAELEHRATFDALTGVLNRATWVTRAEHLLASDQRAGRSTSCLYLDMDGFKEVNDTHGHDAGDDLLRRIAATLQGLDAPDRLVGRLGGDEFVILLPGATFAEATRVARRLEALLHRQVGDGRHPVASIGVATVDVPGTLSDLVSQADNAMMAVKAQRRQTREPIAPRRAREHPVPSSA